MTVIRRRRVPTVLQSSAMDCGPASLAALLRGFGITVDYGELREVCRTEVDGTSIDSLEKVAVASGLDAKQVMLPVDHLLLAPDDALPCLLVVRLPNGLPHFSVAWRRIGPRVELMDPTYGRRWPGRDDFLRRCYVHTQEVPAEAWRTWAASDDFLRPLSQRLERLAVAPRQRREHIRWALEGPDWRRLAALDAAVRFGQTLRDARAAGRRALSRSLDRWIQSAVEHGTEAIPGAFWTVAPAAAEDVLVLRGAVLIKVDGLRRTSRRRAGPVQRRAPEATAAGDRSPRPAPIRLMFRHMYEGRRRLAILAAAATLAAAVGVWLETLVMRWSLEVPRLLGSPAQRLSAGLALCGLAVLVAGLHIPALAASAKLGRRLEIRLRVALATRLPRLGHRYFASRLHSDLAERAHGLAVIGRFPALLRRGLSIGGELLLATLGLVLLAPLQAFWIVPAAILAQALPMLMLPTLNDRHMQERSHATALYRVYLDALQGSTAIRAHGAERVVRHELEALLGQWWICAREALRWRAGMESAQSVLGFAFAMAVLAWGAGQAAGGTLLLIFFWAMQMPDLGRQLTAAVRQLPRIHTAAVRLTEPLCSPVVEDCPRGDREGGSTAAPRLAAATPSSTAHGLAVRWRGVTVIRSGLDILRNVDVELPAGSHVGIVGPSGAGKSTLAGLLLGRDRPAEGGLEVDGLPLVAYGGDRLRRETAWIAPEVRLWDRSLFHNLCYGGEDRDPTRIPAAVDTAELDDLVDGLDAGFATPLGEAGGSVSGGEGQRIRLARALSTRSPRLVVMDEPFRGLDAAARHRLIAKVRHAWRQATLIWITHEVEQTLELPWIWVVEGGRLVEEGEPGSLARRRGSRYRHWIERGAAARELWTSADWRRLRVERGRVADDGKRS